MSCAACVMLMARAMMRRGQAQREGGKDAMLWKFSQSVWTTTVRFNPVVVSCCLRLVERHRRHSSPQCRDALQLGDTMLRGRMSLLYQFLALISFSGGNCNKTR